MYGFYTHQPESITRRVANEKCVLIIKECTCMCFQVNDTEGSGGVEYYSDDDSEEDIYSEGSYDVTEIDPGYVTSLMPTDSTTTTSATSTTTTTTTTTNTTTEAGKTRL